MEGKLCGEWFIIENINVIVYFECGFVLYFSCRVILGKDTNWNNMAEVPEMNTTSGWVLGPSIGQYPVSYNTIAITNLSQISDGIIW